MSDELDTELSKGIYVNVGGSWYKAFAEWNEATGGTVTDVDNYNGTGQKWRVHTFTGNGTFTVTKAYKPFQVFAVGGGGGAGAGSFPGGGGAGGLMKRLSYSIPVGAHAVTVGDGGGVSGFGANSSVYGVTGYGGGHGGDDNKPGADGGCGGGGGSNQGVAGKGSQGGNGSGAGDGGGGGGMGGNASGRSGGPGTTLPTGDYVSRGGYPRGVQQAPASTYGGGGSWDSGSVGQPGVVIIAYQIG